MPKAITDLLTKRTQRGKFYRLVQTWNDADTCDHWSAQGARPCIHTATFLRGWMWVYEQFKSPKTPETIKYLSEGLNGRYQITSVFTKHPESFAWVEITGVDLALVEQVTTARDTFFYTGPYKELRRFPLDKFSSQLAGLLH